jgi:hypothetical protein
VAHLTEKHNVEKQKIDGLGKLLRSLGLLSPKKLARRPDGSLPHPHLAMRRGAECRHCDERRTSINVLSRHLSKSHGMRRKASSGLRGEIGDGLFQSW